MGKNVWIRSTIKLNFNINYLTILSRQCVTECDSVASERFEFCDKAIMNVSGLVEPGEEMRTERVLKP